MSGSHGAQPVGTFYTWWRGDALPEVRCTVNARVQVATSLDATTAAALSAVVRPDEAHALMDGGQQLYLAWAGDHVAAFGWVTTYRLSIGELGVERVLPAGNAYLWGFLTLPDWRGGGLYPWLLQQMLTDVDAEHFWIGHDIDNHASARGILRAGFTPVGEVFLRDDGSLVYVPRMVDERAMACEAIFGIPIGIPPR